jgi:deazaflavin-dependent oxidoreductase (nitroreductase family)
MSQPQFLYLATTGWKTGRQHRIEIWFVEYNGRYYIVSEHPERAHWVKNITHNPQVSFSVGGRTFQGTAQPVEPGSELAAAVSKLMDEKYRWSQGLIVELAP